MNVLFIDADCTEHCLHVIVKDALKIVDGFLVDIGKTWKYYSTLTKVAQLWRDGLVRMSTDSFPKQYLAVGVLTVLRKGP